MGFLDRWFNRPPSQDQFAAMLIKRIRASGYTLPVEYEREEFRLQKGAGSDSFLAFLGNIYQEYLRADKEGRERVVRNFLAMWHTTGRPLPQEFDDARADILPALRARSYFDIDLQFAGDGKARNVPPYETVADHLANSLVYDLPMGMRTLSDEDLEAWGITFYEAMEVAKQNLADKPFNYAEIGKLYALMAGDAYDATRMMLRDVVRSFPVEGDVLAMVPNRERLYVVGSEDEDGLRAMLDLVDQDIQHERWISGMVFRLVADEWETWLPDADHPLYARFRQHALQTMGQMYAGQTELLNRKHQQAGIDLFVAAYSGRNDEATGSVKSYCMWIDNVGGLLPRTDEVLFVRPDGANAKPLARASWQEVRRHAGELMEWQDIYPERWRVREFPSAEVLGQFTAWDG